MPKVCLVSCVSEKLAYAAPAAELYISDLFRKARRHATERADRWYILSAEHGLVKPDAVTAPYNKTLKAMPVAERRRWANEVLKSLQKVITADDEVTFLAGEFYREFLIPQIEALGVRVRVPMEGLGIGEQLHWLNSPHAQDLERFYSLLDDLSRKGGGPRPLRDCRGRDGWPPLGVYFFFEPDEMRAAKPLRHRVVRVGTHAISEGSKSTLWGRLRAHRGSCDGRGNHRGSIFRLHTGAAVLRRDGLTDPATWGIGSHATRAVKDLEVEMERCVSAYLGNMSLLWLAVADPANPTSNRAVIESNAIGLLTKRDALVDPPSVNWLGHHSAKEEIRTSGLWNVNHVGTDYSPSFLGIFENCIAAMKSP